MTNQVFKHNNITATIIADSINDNGIRMTSMEIEYPRFIIAELNTHRMLAKNSASSRAIPVKTMHEQIRKSPAMPVYWGKNQGGMSAKEELTGSDLEDVQALWSEAREFDLSIAARMEELGLHKQIANRRTEADMLMKTVISGTEWANMFWLRTHATAQPEFKVLADLMLEAQLCSKPMLLKPGQWHLPYILLERLGNRIAYYAYSDPDTEISLMQARIISASCCAQVSYRRNDDSYTKALKVYRQLIESSPVHASPVEHQATPMKPRSFAAKLLGRNFTEEGITHVDRQGNRWSGCLQDWIQFRKLIPNESKQGVMEHSI